MNPETLKYALEGAQELVNSAKRVRENTFQKLAPDCERREKTDVPSFFVCRYRRNKGYVEDRCSMDRCPYILGVKDM
jgi:hypothetical protein